MARLQPIKRAAVIVCAVLLLAACRGGGGGGSSATDEIKAAYTGFFSTTGSLADHEALLEDGAKLKSVIQTSRIIYSPAGSVSATVSKVTLQGPAKAEVVFSVKFSLFTLKDRVGYAVLQGGKWKVASGTLCALLTIYQGSVPLACKS